MGKISDRYRNLHASQSSDWKDSRLVIAALSVAGTATFMSTVILPITTSALTAKLENLAPAEEKIKKLEKELAEANKRASAAESTAAQATAKTPFIPGSVYPVGIEKVTIGATQESLLETYPGGAWNEEKDFYTAKTGHPHFGTVTYYFLGSPKKQNVTMILFHLNHDSPLNNGAIKDRFAVLFGPPHAEGKYGRLWWKATQRESIEITNSHSYQVEKADLKPMWVDR